MKRYSEKEIVMKRYFELIGENVTVAFGMTKEGMTLPIEKLNEDFKNSILRELDKKEYDKLSKEYTGGDK